MSKEAMCPIINMSLPSDVRKLLVNKEIITKDDNISDVVIDFMQKYELAQSNNQNLNFSFFLCNYKKNKISKQNSVTSVYQRDEQPILQPSQMQPILSFNQIPQFVNSNPSYSYANYSDKKNGKPMTAYKAAQILMRRVPFLAIDEALYAFNGKYYELQTETSAKRTILHYCRELVNQVGTVEIIKQILELVKIEPAISWKELKPSNQFVIFKNSILDLQAMQMMPLTPKIFDTSCLDIDYVANASLVLQNFNQFLWEIAGGNELLIQRIWQVIGYLITNDTDGKCFFVMQGVSNSGKSLLGRFIASLYNSDAVTSLDINSLGERFSMAEIVGKKLNISLDLPQGVIKNDAVSNIKQLTGGDLISTDVKYMSRIKFLNTCRLLYATNHAITLSNPDEAFENRMVIIPFTISIPPERRDPYLLQKFEQEKLGIIIKAVQSYQELVADNYQFAGDFPANGMIKSASNKTTLDLQSLVQEFVEQCCLFKSYDQGTLTCDLFNSFIAYAGSCVVISVMEFSKLIQEVCGSKIIKQRWRDAKYGKNPKWGFRGIISKSCADVPLCQDL